MLNCQILTDVIEYMQQWKNWVPAASMGIARPSIVVSGYGVLAINDSILANPLVNRFEKLSNCDVNPYLQDDSKFVGNVFAPVGEPIGYLSHRWKWKL